MLGCLSELNLNTNFMVFKKKEKSCGYMYNIDIQETAATTGLHPVCQPCQRNYRVNIILFTDQQNLLHASPKY